MSRKMPIFYSALMLTGVNLLLRLVSTTFQVFLSGRLGASGVGLLQLVMSVGSLTLTAGMAGIRTATMYLTAEELGKQRPGNVKWILRGCLLYCVLCSGVISIGLYLFSPLVAEYWIRDLNTVAALRTFSLFLPIVCVSGCLSGYFTAANRIGTLAAVEIAEQAAYMVATMGALLLWAGDDPGKACQCVVLGSGISACVTAVSLWILRLRNEEPPAARIPVSARLLRTAVPLALADDLKIGINTVENLMVPQRLSQFKGLASPLAAFGMVSGMVFPVLMFPAAIIFALAELLIPEFARCQAAGSRKRIQYLAKRSLKLGLLYGCFCGGGLYLISDPLCQWLYRNEEVGQMLQLYSVLAPMLYSDAITDAINKGLGQQNTAVRYNIVTATLDVAGLYVLLPRYGMQGYFISFLISHLINFLLSVRLLIRTAGIRIPFHIPALTISAVLAAVTGAGLVTGIFWKCLAYLGLLGCLLILFQVLSWKDLLWLRGLVQKK